MQVLLLVGVGGQGEHLDQAAGDVYAGIGRVIRNILVCYRIARGEVELDSWKLQ